MRIERRAFHKLALAGVAMGFTGSANAQAKPLTIGFGMALTGGLAPNGKGALLAMQIAEEDINARGGLLGRPVKLVYYDDQSNPSTVPGLYTKLMDVDKVDVVVSGYATNMIAPAMPVVMQKDRTFFSLLGLAVNSEFHHPRYFSITPTGGPRPKESFAEGFFEVAMEQNPKPQTLALIGADAEFPRNAMEGVRNIAKKAGVKIVYDKTYPPTTADYTPIVRAVAATNPDLLVICSYPPDSVGLVRSINEIGFKPKMVGGGMVGLQATALKAQLGAALNGFVNFDFWLPVPKIDFPGIDTLLQKYQARAQAEGVDPLGYYMAPWGYAQLQVMAQAIEATKSVDDRKLADFIRTNSFKTVLGDIKFGKGGEWAQSRVLQVQFHDIKGNDIEQFRAMGTQTVLTPEEYKSGSVIYPYEKAK